MEPKKALTYTLMAVCVIGGINLGWMAGSSIGCTVPTTQGTVNESTSSDAGGGLSKNATHITVDGYVFERNGSDVDYVGDRYVPDDTQSKLNDRGYFVHYK